MYRGSNMKFLTHPHKPRKIRSRESARFNLCLPAKVFYSGGGRRRVAWMQELADRLGRRRETEVIRQGGGQAASISAARVEPARAAWRGLSMLRACTLPRFH